MIAAREALDQQVEVSAGELRRRDFEKNRSVGFGLDDDLIGNVLAGAVADANRDLRRAIGVGVLVAAVLDAAAQLEGGVALIVGGDAHALEADDGRGDALGPAAQRLTECSAARLENRRGGLRRITGAGNKRQIPGPLVGDRSEQSHRRNGCLEIDVILGFLRPARDAYVNPSAQGLGDLGFDHRHHLRQAVALGQLQRASLLLRLGRADRVEVRILDIDADDRVGDRLHAGHHRLPLFGGHDERTVIGDGAGLGRRGDTRACGGRRLGCSALFDVTQRRDHAQPHFTGLHVRRGLDGLGVDVERHDEASLVGAEHVAPRARFLRQAGEDLHHLRLDQRARVEQPGVTVIGERGDAGLRDVLVRQSLGDRPLHRPGAHRQVGIAEDAHDQQDRQRDFGEADHLAQHDFQSRRRLGDHAVDHAVLDLARQVGARQDDGADRDQQAGGEDAEFGGLADGVLLIERTLELGDDDDADDRQRGNEKHPPPPRLHPHHVRDRPDPLEVQPQQVREADDDPRGDAQGEQDPA